MAGEHRYLLHGVRIASELELRDLQLDTEPRETQVRISVGEVPAVLNGNVARLGNQAQYDGRLLLLSLRDNTRFLITANQIVVAPDTAANTELLQVFLLGTAWAACCHQRDLLLLHASAALVDTTCIAFLGNSGAGKSTLAALLAARGHRLAADDTCVLASLRDATHLQPGAPSLKLWRDALPLVADQATQVRAAAMQSGKFRVSLATRWLREPLRVQRLLLLDSDTDGSSPCFERLTPLDAVQAIAAHTFRRKLLPLLGRQQQNFRACAAVVATTQVYRWIRPWGEERQLQMIEMLEDWLHAPECETSTRTNSSLPIAAML
jgi:hypothetical protein